MGGFEYPPYSIIKSLYLEMIPQKIEIHNFDNLEIDVSSLIHIQNHDDIIDYRIFLINYIWDYDTLEYDSLPDKIEKNISDERFSDLKNLKQIDQITISMDYGVNSKPYLFVPINSNNKLVIYHQGHSGDFLIGKNTIQYFLDNNFSVLAFSMPLIYPYNQPVVITSEADIKITLLEDKFLVMNLVKGREYFNIRYQVKPFMIWIWISVLLISFGGIISLFKKKI